MSFGRRAPLTGMTTTFHGSCTCGAVAFTCELDLAAGTTRCNCSFCKKARFWMAFVPTGALTITKGQSELTDFRRTPANRSEPFLHLYFCKHCGIRPFSQGGVMPGMPDGFYAVNLACLDDLDEATLAAAPIKYVDGAHDDWASTPAVTGHL